MCGILLHYCPNNNHLNDELIEFPEGTEFGDTTCTNESSIFNKIIPYIAARGPNYSSLRAVKAYRISWFSSVLSLRQPFTKQSINVDDRYFLQFNGELYNKEISQAKFVLFVTPDNELYVASVTGSAGSFQDCIGGVIYEYDTRTKLLNSNQRSYLPYEVTSEIDLNFTSLSEVSKNLYAVLRDSVKKRVESIHPRHIENSPIAVLFSGGIDCSVIVALICEVLQENDYKCGKPVIELLNVSFENPRTGLFPRDTPDRKLSINSAKTLQNLYPNIDIKLVEVDVPYDEYLKWKPFVINLMYPKQTEMDLSIAIAFFFASRGRGFLTSLNGERTPYQRHGIVLFSGLGADELYGGYHKFANKPPHELVEELTRQINNIYDRNLNRDDKVIAHNGVEVRYPFLDEYVIKLSTAEIPINFKVNKLILRKVASQYLKLDGISSEPKRAIQFGAKSAKMTKDGNKHGTDLLKENRNCS
ncbi:asparagine synthetase [Saccharomyces cerevisiae]|nr:asparagine synthetase [Saccharomyces boulardii (nom. inval.)]